MNPVRNSEPKQWSRSLISNGVKIVIAAEIFPPDIGGPATYSPKIAQALVEAGHQVSLICYSDKAQKDDYPFTVIRIIRSKFKLHYFKYYRQLKKLTADCDVIYAQGPVSSGWPALKVKKKLGKKFVVKVVGDYAWEQAQNFGLTKLGIDEFQSQKFGGKIGTLQKIERQVCQQADKVIVPSQYLKKIVVGWGVTENKIEVVYNAVDFIAVDPVVKSHEENWLISVGRLVPWKGFETLISITPDIIKDVDNFRLKIVGDGPEMKKLQLLVEKLELDNIVELLGQKTRKDMLAYVHAADLFILNSGYEGLSHVLIEALGLGRPVLASNVGGNPEVIIPGETGDLFEYNNKEEIKNKVISFFKRGIMDKKLLLNDDRKYFFSRFEFAKMIKDTINVLESL